MSAKFEIKSARNGYRFNLKAANGKVILTSETYTTKTGAENGIAAVKTNSRKEDRFEAKTARNGESYFVLKAANGEPIGTSETYQSESGCRNGIESVRRNAGSAKIESSV